MQLVSFDALRTLHFPSVTYIKPDHMFREAELISRSDGVLFAEYWQITALVYGLKSRIFPSLASYLIGHDKVEMTRCFQMVSPRHVPLTFIEANTPANGEKIWDLMPLPFVAKIPRSSMGQGVFLIEERQQWRAYLLKTPVIYAQEYLPIDRDLRIVWVGDQIVGGYWRVQSARGFYNNVAQGGQIVPGPIPPEAATLVEQLASSLNIDHGGFDIAMVGNVPYVLEFNRLFGNKGLSHLNPGVDEHIMQYLQRHWTEDDPVKPVTPTLLTG